MSTDRQKDLASEVGDVAKDKVLGLFERMQFCLLNAGSACGPCREAWRQEVVRFQQEISRAVSGVKEAA